MCRSEHLGRLKVLKAGPANVYDDTRLWLNVYIALLEAGMLSDGLQYSGPQPMNLGKSQVGFYNREVSRKYNPKLRYWRKKATENNGCFKMIKARCRPL